jgi:hypothetical protein
LENNAQDLRVHRVACTVHATFFYSYGNRYFFSVSHILLIPRAEGGGERERGVLAGKSRTVDGW